MSNNKEIFNLIRRRRRQVLFHSFLYYVMDINMIDDSTWSVWAEELEVLQRDYPDIAEEVEMNNEFKGFDHSTGANLVYDTPETEWVYSEYKLLKGNGYL